MKYFVLLCDNIGNLIDKIKDANIPFVSSLSKDSELGSVILKSPERGIYPADCDLAFFGYTAKERDELLVSLPSDCETQGTAEEETAESARVIIPAISEKTGLKTLVITNKEELSDILKKSADTLTTELSELSKTALTAFECDYELVYTHIIPSEDDEPNELIEAFDAVMSALHQKFSKSEDGIRTLFVLANQTEQSPFILTNKVSCEVSEEGENNIEDEGEDKSEVEIESESEDESENIVDSDDIIDSEIEKENSEEAESSENTSSPRFPDDCDKGKFFPRASLLFRELISKEADKKEAFIETASEEASNNLDTDSKEAEANLQKPLSHRVFEWVELFSISLSIVLILMTFFVRHSPVVGSSMSPTLEENDILVISRLGYTPEVGDIVIIQTNKNDLREPLVKRIIAVGGQTVRINFTTWEIFIDGEKLKEEYLDEVDKTNMMKLQCIDRYFMRLDEDSQIYEATVPENEVFVMGDNRNKSKDSRDLGFIDERHIVGEVKFRILPLSKFGKVD